MRPARPLRASLLLVVGLTGGLAAPPAAAKPRPRPRAAAKAPEMEISGPAVSPFAKETARAAFENAERLFRDKRYAEAEVEYQAAYSIWPLDGFFFNIAQCERNQDHTAEAIDYFERYLGSGHAQKHRAEVEALLEELRDKLAADAPKDSAFAPPAPRTAAAPRSRDGGQARP